MREDEKKRWEWVIMMLERDFGEKNIMFIFRPFEPYDEMREELNGASIRFFVPRSSTGIDKEWLHIRFVRGVAPDFDMYRNLSRIFNNYRIQVAK